MSKPVTTEQLVSFRTLLQAKFYPEAQEPVITIEPGAKYARIVLTQGPSRSAYGFIDLANGDLLKSDSWKKPAKHARGNIFASNPLAGCGPYGMAYLK
jgi:hypothetical protein